MKKTISKMDAARGQLQTAIALFFRRSDPVSIHTLTSASLGILHDHFDLDSAWENNLTLHYHSIWIKDEYRKEWIDKVRESSNFFKHADKDLREGKIDIEFNPEVTPIHMFEALRCISILEKDGFNFLPEFQAFWAWFVLRYPHFFTGEIKKRAEEYKDLDVTDLDMFKNVIDYLKINPIKSGVA